MAFSARAGARMHLLHKNIPCYLLCPNSWSSTYTLRRLSYSRAFSSSRRNMAALKTPWTPNTYPPSRSSDHVDVYKSEKQGEVRVADPYRWLEENSPETEAWVEAQEAFTRKYLDQNPRRENLEKSIRANTDFEKVC